MTVFTDIFTGAPLQPSDVGYTSYTLTADKTLSWPSTATTSDTVARIMTIVCNGAYSLTFPAANEVSTGQDTLITNTGSSTLTVKDSTGATITTVAAGAVKYIYLTDNATVAGVWAAVAFGVGTSNVDAAALAGYGLLAVSTTLNQSCPVTSISTPTTAGAADRARLIVDTTGITITLPSAATIGNNFFTFIRNGSSGTTTIAPSGGDLIDNGASVALNPAESVMVICSGTAWYTVGWGRSVTFNYTQLTKNVAGGTDVTLSAAEAGYKILKFTGLLTANINVVVPTTTTIWYVDNSTTGGYTLTVKTSAGSGVSTTNGTRYVLYGDGTNVVNAVTVTGSFSSFTTGSASAPSITFAADTDTGLYNTAANQVGVAVAGTQVANFTASGAAITGAVSADSAAITGAVSADSASLTTPLPVTSGGTGTTTNPASAVANTPAGNIAATNVQAAINELDTEKAKSGANSDITSLSGLTSLNGGALAGFRNYIINGNCQIAQRAQGALSALYQYGSVDNFQVAILSGTGITGVIGQYGLSTDSLGFGVVGSWTNGQFSSRTAIESVDSAKLNGKTVTISAKVYQNTGGSRNFEILVDKPSAADNYTSSTTISTSSAQAVPHNTITSISHTFTLGASDASNGLAVIIRDTATNTVVSKSYIVGSVQLEEGSTATPIENRPYATELTLCRRYYWKSYNRGVNAGAVSDYGKLLVTAQATSNYLGGGATLPVEMFENPIVNAYSTTSGTIARGSVDGVDVAVITGGGQNSVLFYINNVATTANQFLSVHITAEASIL